jgi:hypothetical protein
MAQNPEPTTAEIERGVVHMAYVVDRYGERYAPILDSLIGHLEAARRRESPRERARRILDQAEADGIVVPRWPKK